LAKSIGFEKLADVLTINIPEKWYGCNMTIALAWARRAPRSGTPCGFPPCLINQNTFDVAKNPKPFGTVKYLQLFI
jgi:hypothetical protein